MKIKIVKQATNAKPKGWCPWYVDDFPSTTK
jgi:hypothetical protein